MVIGTAFSRSRQKDDLCHILSLRSMQVLTGKKPIVLIVFSPFRRRTRMPAQPGTGGYGKLWQHRRQCPDSSSTKHNQIKSAEPYLEIYLEYPCVSSNSRRCYSIPLALVSEYRSPTFIQQHTTAINSPCPQQNLNIDLLSPCLIRLVFIYVFSLQNMSHAGPSSPDIFKKRVETITYHHQAMDVEASLATICLANSDFSIWSSPII